MTAARDKSILATWATLLITGFVFIALIDVWQGRYALQARDKRPETHLSAAERAMNANNFAGAMMHWEEAHKRAPEDAQVYKVLGDIHYNLKAWQKAHDAYRRALDLGSPAPGVRTNLLWVLVELGQYQDALEFGRKCVNEGMNDPDVYRRMAEACFRGKRFTESIDYYDKALLGFPNDLYLMEHLRQACQITGEYGRAKKLEAQIAQLQASMTALEGKHADGK